MKQEPHENYMKRKFLEEEIEELKSRLKPQATGHIHTSISTLKERYKELTGVEYKSPRIYESPDKGKTVYSREMGSLERRKEDTFIQHGKDEHEVYLSEDAVNELIQNQTAEPANMSQWIKDDMYFTGDGSIDFLPEEDDDEFPNEDDYYAEFIKPAFHEHVYIDELKNYIKSTYDQHYAVKGRLQSTEVVIDRGRGLDFCLGNIDKYSNRYGLKGTVDDYRKDLMKIAHYAIIALYCHDKKYSD
jgi:hypothetical protein